MFNLFYKGLAQGDLNGSEQMNNYFLLCNLLQDFRNYKNSAQRKSLKGHKDDSLWKFAYPWIIGLGIFHWPL